MDCSTGIAYIVGGATSPKDAGFDGWNANSSPNQHLYRSLSSEAGVKRAFRKLERIRKDIVWWEAAAQPRAFIGAGTVSMSSAYTLWFDPAQDRNRHMRIVWRQSLYDIDSWAIPAGTPKRDDAYRFIAFASEPQQQSTLSEQLKYGPTNRHALDLLPAELADTLPSSTPNLAGALRIDSAFWIEHGDALERRFNAWAPAICRQRARHRPAGRTRRGVKNDHRDHERCHALHA